MNLEDIIYNREMGFFRKKQQPTGFLQIKEHLHKLNPELPDSQISQLAANIAKEQPQDPSKRKLLQTIAKGAAGLAAVAAFPSLAFSQEQKFPPGVTTCTDEKLVQAYELWHTNKEDYKNYALMLMGFSIGGSWIKKDTPNTQPLYHLLTFEMKKGEFINFKKLEKINSPLYYCSKGIAHYFIAFKTQDWRDYRMSYEETVKKSKNYFAKSYVLACGNPESDYKTLLNRIDNWNKYVPSKYNSYNELLSNIKDEFLKNLIENQQKQNHNNKLTAAWSSFFLTTIYELTQEGDPMKELNTKKIKTISGFIGTYLEYTSAKNIKHYIRGPPGNLI